MRKVSNEIDFRSLKVKAKENIRYKKIVGSECSSEYLQFSKYSKEIWRKLVENHLYKEMFFK